MLKTDIIIIQMERVSEENIMQLLYIIVIYIVKIEKLLQRIHKFIIYLRVYFSSRVVVGCLPMVSRVWLLYACDCSWILSCC